MDSLGINIYPLLFKVLLLSTVVICIPLFIGFYYLRRSEIGPELARREIKLSAIILVVVVPLALLVAFSLTSLIVSTDPSGAETFVILLISTLIAFFIGYPLCWWSKTRKALRSELFRVPVKASKLILVIVIMWPVLGIAYLIFFTTSREPMHFFLALSHLLQGLFLVVVYFRPTWYITQKGISWPFIFIKWEKILEQEWQSKNDKEVVLRLHIKRWLPIKLPLNQNIPIEYERPLKAMIQKYTNQQEPSPPQL